MSPEAIFNELFKINQFKSAEQLVSPSFDNAWVQIRRCGLLFQKYLPTKCATSLHAISFQKTFASEINNLTLIINLFEREILFICIFIEKESIDLTLPRSRSHM